MRGAVVVIALAGACVMATPAVATAHSFSVVLSPASVAAGARVEFTAKLTNRGTDLPLGSANLTPPAGFTILSASAPTPATATVAGNVVQLRNLGLAFGQSVTATVVAVTPCAAGTAAWDVIAKSTPDFSGTASGPLVDSQLNTTVTGSNCVFAATVCNENVACMATLANADASLTVSAPADTSQSDGGVLVINRNIGALDCADYEELLDNDFSVDFVPNQGAVARAKTVTLFFSRDTMKNLPDNGLSHLNMCFSAPSFEPQVLKDCGTPPCVVNRQPQDGGAVIVARAPGGNQDPRFGG
jgi:hypothetical protein